MNTVATLCCVLAVAAVVRPSPTGHQPEREPSLNSLAARPRQLAAESGLAGIASMETIGTVLQTLWTIGSQLATVLGAESVGDDVARALHETDPVELALNTIDLDTVPCRQRLACEIRSSVTEYAFGGMMYELLSSRMPALRKYGRVSAREMGVPRCRDAFTCRFSDSPLMGTARSMRSLASSVCNMEGDSIASMVCRAFAFTIDTLETL